MERLAHSNASIFYIGLCIAIQMRIVAFNEITYHSIECMAVNAFAYLFDMFLIRFTVLACELSVWRIE